MFNCSYTGGGRKKPLGDQLEETLGGLLKAGPRDNILGKGRVRTTGGPWQMQQLSLTLFALVCGEVSPTCGAVLSQRQSEPGGAAGSLPAPQKQCSHQSFSLGCDEPYEAEIRSESRSR